MLHKDRNLTSPPENTVLVQTVVWGLADGGLGTELGHSYLGGLGQVMATSLNLHLRVLMSF